MQAGLKADASNGFDHFLGSVGGENLSGGEAANGIPKYLLAGAVADGALVVVPMTAPEDMVTVGRLGGAALAQYSKLIEVMVRRNNIVAIGTGRSSILGSTFEYC